MRTERGRSQGELVDPDQASRYENGRITSSSDIVVRVAETFDVTSPNSARSDLAPHSLVTKTRLKTVADGIS